MTGWGLVIAREAPRVRQAVRFLLSVPALLLAAALTGSAAEPALEATLGQQTPRYLAHARSRSGEFALRLRVRAEVRSVRFWFQAVPPASPQENTIVQLEVLPYPPPPGREAAPLFRGQVIQTPDTSPGRDRQLPWRIYLSEVTLKPREEEVRWELRLKSLPKERGEPPPPLHVAFRIEADARPITDRERELMAWRATIDPARQPEEVRAKVATLTDEEVGYYTGFKDRASFLKHWQRTKQADLIDPKTGALTLNAETSGLTAYGKPLPDGQYLHHNGKPLPLE